MESNDSVIGLLRADGNSTIGSGHVMRILALAQSLKNLGEMVFVTDETISSSLLNRFSENGFKHYLLEQLDSEAEVDLLRHRYPQTQLVVTDGYHFTEAYHSYLQQSGFKVARVVDFTNRHYIADLIINHSPGVCVEDYTKNSNTPLCLGLDFALLQPAFIQRSKSPIKLIERQHLFINVGGADPDNATGHLLQLLENIEWVDKINVVIGALNPNRNDLLKLAEKSEHIIHIHTDLTAESIIELLDDSKIAICSASTIAIEACACRVPLLIGWAVDNQKLIYDGLIEKNMAIGLGKFNQLNEKKLGDIMNQLTESNQPLFSLMQNMQKEKLPGNSEKNLVAAFKSLLVNA